MKITNAVVALLAVSALAGCGNASKTQGPASPSIAESQATSVSVLVRFIQVGGPLNAEPSPIAGGQVQAVYEGPLVSRPYTLTTDANGLATFKLRPGKYAFVGRETTASHSYCRSESPALQIAAGGDKHTPTVTIECIVP